MNLSRDKRVVNDGDTESFARMLLYRITGEHTSIHAQFSLFTYKRRLGHDYHLPKDSFSLPEKIIGAAGPPARRVHASFKVLEAQSAKDVKRIL